MRRDEKNCVIDALAWDLVACAQNPPLHPTTSAVLRTLCVFRVVPFSLFASLLPCNSETTRQQLRRLIEQGLVERIVLKQRGRTAMTIYALTADGLRLMDMWESARRRLLQSLTVELDKIHE